jgi:dihydroorotase-like cyclic amidohydrolase
MKGKNRLNDGLLFDFFRQVASVPGGVAMVHCENAELLEWGERAVIGLERHDTVHWEQRAPIFGELESIRRALFFAEEAGVSKLVIVHLGVGSGIEFLREKRRGTMEVTVESCPHYLAFDKDQDLGIAGKVNPPLRDRGQVNALWDRIADRTIDIIGSDQLAFTSRTKGENFWNAPTGITGGMPMILSVLLTEGVRRGRLSLPRLVELTSTRAAQVFGLYPRKGTLEVGSDADLVILDEDREVRVTCEVLNTVSDYSAYEGYQAHGWAGVTVAGGRVVYENGEVVDAMGGGRLLTTAP